MFLPLTQAHSQSRRCKPVTVRRVRWRSQGPFSQMDPFSQLVHERFGRFIRLAGWGLGLEVEAEDSSSSESDSTKFE